ncbi:F-actin-capping protein subunit alpha-2 [Hondaea fermentalgiana]|uniref:F-actin-capping protein subunit alpha n=1 Tax=Hondaea fermentalgiana TaxID=2315210 RepID=A0A2R5GVJ6_9STRA|nr:F-actin-capping protein subunit alpha-2 [Hondaea fermentalgiana]|eukprot:GBG34866.1 F-actin-capping protein subunit alpha-2 [Hondaea fermentalgiana]
MASFADEDEEYPEVTDEEKLAIASQFLLQSPPGQIKEVLRDLKNLCSEDVLAEDVVAGVFHRYNNATQQVIGSIVCDEATEIDEGHYLDPASQSTVHVDHLHHKVINENASDDVPPPDFPEEAMEMREAVEHELNEYIGEQYVKGTTTLSVVCSKDGYELVVLISGEKINLKNYWSGRWRSRFVVNINDCSLSGFVKINCHTFEDGNVQLDTSKNVSDIKLSFDNSASLGVAVRKKIVSIESKVQDSLEDMYVNMSQEAFKDMRRALPITRQKMDWSGAQMQLAKGFSKSK